MHESPSLKTVISLNPVTHDIVFPLALVSSYRWTLFPAHFSAFNIQRSVLITVLVDWLNGIADPQERRRSTRARVI